MRGFLCDEQFAELPLVFKDLRFYSAVTERLAPQISLGSGEETRPPHSLSREGPGKGSAGLGDVKASPVAAL